jgi:hypothetical protein
VASSTQPGSRRPAACSRAALAAYHKAVPPAGASYGRVSGHGRTHCARRAGIGISAHPLSLMPMPRDGAIIFGDLIGKLDVVRVE